MMSGHGTIETAVKATKLGAFDFIEKPLSLDKIIIMVNNALNVVRLKEENVLLKQKVSHQYELTGNSPANNRTQRNDQHCCSYKCVDFDYGGKRYGQGTGGAFYSSFKPEVA